MFDSAKGNEREVGKVITVTNFRVTVQLDPELRSQVRSYSRQVTLVTQLGGYLLFPVAPGEHVVGIIVEASENEAIEPASDESMTLQLSRARRLVKLNLVGQLKDERPFSAGVTIYPALEAPALLPSEDQLCRILECPPGTWDEARDTALKIGESPTYFRQSVSVSFNDLLSRPMGIIGNTGSGKSYSVASLIQGALQKLQDISGDSQAKFIILDINGEYGAAFQSSKGDVDATECPRQLNKVYLEGRPFHVPLWAFNLRELIAFFEASEASQVPILERVVTCLREDAIDANPGSNVRAMVRVIDDCICTVSGRSREKRCWLLISC